jgi:hypothetical protein
MPPAGAAGASARFFAASGAPAGCAEGASRTVATNAMPDAAAPSDKTRTTMLNRRRITLLTAIEIRPRAHLIVAGGDAPLELRGTGGTRAAREAHTGRKEQPAVARQLHMLAAALQESVV